LTKFIELADVKLDDYLQRLDQSDAAESKTGGSRVKNLTEKIAALRERRTRCKDMLAQLDRTGEDQISLTDPIAARWRRTRVLPWATTCKLLLIPSTS
jgi:hypothetical protein